MVKVKIDNARGLVQQAGSGLDIDPDAVGAGLVGVARSAATTTVATGAHDVELNFVQPAGTVLTDLGVVAVAATVGAANINVKVGTSDDGNQLCAAKAMVSSGVAAVGSVISLVSAAEGTEKLVITDNQALYTATARTIFVRAEISATNTAGTLQSFGKFVKLTG